MSVVTDVVATVRSRAPQIVLMSLVASSVVLFQIVAIHGARTAFQTEISFFILPLVLLGFGIGGAAAYLRPFTSNRLLLIYALATPLPFVVMHATFGTEHTALVTAMFLASSFFVNFVAGWFLASLLDTDPDVVPVLICADLLGACAGAVVAVAALTYGGYVPAVLVSTLVAVLTTVWARGHTTLQRIVYTILVLLFGALLLQTGVATSSLRVICPTSEDPVAFASNSIAEISVTPTIIPGRHELGPSGQGSAVFYTLRMNCTAGATVVMRAEPNELKFLAQELRSIPLSLWSTLNGTPEHVFIPSAGGGFDVVRALYYGTKQLDATEFNPNIVALTKQFSASSTYPYADPRVHLFVGDTRRFLATNQSKYDLVLNYFGARFGAFSGLSDTPNYAGSVEIFTTLFDRTNERGMFAIAGPPGFSTLDPMIRVFARMGIDPTGRVIYIPGVQGREELTLARREPFTLSERATIERLTKQSGFVAYVFGVTPNPPYNATHIGQGGVTNDRPYALSDKSDFQNFSEDSYRMQAAVAVGVGISLLLMLFVVAYLRIPELRTLRTSLGAGALSISAAAIGIGFIFFELWAVQRMYLALSDPTLGFAVSVGAILLFGALGGLSVRFVPKARVGWYSAVLTGALIVFCVFGYPSDALLNSVIPYGLSLRVLFVAAYLALPAFVCGVYLPILLRTSREMVVHLIPLVWAIDGIFSIVGGLLARVVFRTSGLHTAFMVIAIVYALALGALLITLYLSRIKATTPQK